MIEIIENDQLLVTLEINNGILIVKYTQHVKITLKQAKMIVEQRREFTNKKSMPTLVINSGTIVADKATRDYFSSEEGITGIKCAALMVNNNFTSFMLNFFLKITKPKLLVKTYSNKKDALTWLSTFVD